jgi:hypothetical protein
VKDNPEFREADEMQNTIEPQQITVPSHNTPLLNNDGLDEDESILWLRKTEYPDVYDVYSTDYGMAQNTKVGVAHVPSLKISKWLRNEFKNATVAMYIPFKCRKHEIVGKWVPVEKITCDEIA